MLKGGHMISSRHILSLLLILGVSFLNSCAQSPTQLKRKQPLPPLRADTIKTRISQMPYDPLPPQGCGPLMKITTKGKRFRGDTTFTGTFSTSRDSQSNLLHMLVTGGSPGVMPETTSIGFSLPHDISLFKPDPNEYSLHVRNIHSVVGADEELRLSNGHGDLHVGYLWKVKTDTIAFTPANNIVIFQVPPETLPQDDTLLIVRPRLRRRIRDRIGEKDITEIVPIGEAFPFDSGGKQYVGFVQTSAYQFVKQKGSDVTTGYILRAIVVSR